MTGIESRSRTGIGFRRQRPSVFPDSGQGRGWREIITVWRALLDRPRLGAGDLSGYGLTRPPSIEQDRAELFSDDGRIATRAPSSDPPYRKRLPGLTAGRLRA